MILWRDCGDRLCYDALRDLTHTPSFPPSKAALMEAEQRKFRADPLKLKRLRVAAGLTVKEFTEQADLDRTTVRKILGGEPVFLKSIKQAGELVFQIDSPLELLHPDELRAMGVQTDVPSPSHVLEWEIAEYLSGWRETSNGLQHQIVRLTHRYLPGRSARGKCYELRHLPSAERERLEDHLRRHVEVCERVGNHPHMARNLTAAEAGGLWWVLDQWEAGVSLDDRLQDEPLSEFGLYTVMTGIAQGLAALHQAGVIRRELAPRYVLLRESDDRPVLMDLELAKLTDGGPTVSPDEWPDDPYRALEVTGEAPIDERADLYSWGRLFVHAAEGTLPERGAEQITRSDVPGRIKGIVQDCLATGRSQRPASMQVVLKVLNTWQP